MIALSNTARIKIIIIITKKKNQTTSKSTIQEKR